MAISKIKINGTEHELETTIANVSGLQDVLDNKANDSDKADSVKTALGEAVSLSNSVHTPLYGFKLYGKTTQDGTPTPEAPVELVSAGGDGGVDVAVYGKNLLGTSAFSGTTISGNGLTAEVEAENIIHIYGTVTRAGSVDLELHTGSILFHICKDKKYTFHAEVMDGALSGTGKLYPYLAIGSTATERKNWIAIAITSTNVPNDIIYITKTPASMLENARYATRFWVYGSDFSLGDTVDIRLKLWVTQTESSVAYEPYKKPQTLTVSTPNGLPGIPVSSGGNYTDSNGQQWICDEVDFTRGVYVQRVGNIELTGQEGWDIYQNLGHGVVNCFRCKFNNKNMIDFITMSNANKLPVLSNYFEYGGYIGRNAPTSVGISEGSYIYFRFDGENDTIANTQQFTEWLANKKTENATVIVRYILAAPIETPLSAEQLQAYASLHTNEPNTTIINDGNAGMEVKYYTPSTAVQMVHSPSDEGKILSIDEHGCVVLSENNSVPVSTADDDGKFLRVVNGVAAWAIVPNAEEATF